MNRKKSKGIDFVQRTCAGCRKAKEKSGMIRIVLCDGALAVDRTGKAKGRGVYICRSKECFDEAVKKKGFQRAFRRNFSEEELGRLEEDMEDLMAKAGQPEE